MSYIPVFARAGAVIPTFAQAPKTTMGLAPESIDLHAFVPRAEGEYASVLHEDDGLSFAVQRGAFLRTDFTLIREGDRLKLRAEVSGAGYPEFKRKSFRLFLHGLNAPNVKVNGESMPLKDNLWLDLPNTGEAFEIESVVSG
jgi:alpha-glucosidase